MKKQFTLQKNISLFVCLLLVLGASAVTRTNPASGNWNNTSTWNVAGTPGCGDSINISAGTTVSITNQQNYSSCSQPLKIVIWGHLKFFLGSKLSLPCGSYILVQPGGLIDADVGLANSNLIEICGNVEWNSNSPLNGPACIPASHPVCQGLLPVKLAMFGAEACAQGQICLKWTTFSEKNNDHFLVERSGDAGYFEDLAKIQSMAPAGNSQSKIEYQFTDRSPLVGNNYYRLKQVDKDLAESLSDIVLASSNSGAGFHIMIYPNFNPGEFSILAFNLVGAERIDVQIRSSTGEVLYEQGYSSEGKEARLEVKPPLKIPPGMYVCVVKAGKNTCNSKLIVRE